MGFRCALDRYTLRSAAAGGSLHGREQKCMYVVAEISLSGDRGSCCRHKHLDLSSIPGAGDVWFSLNGTIYQNNSVVTLEDIGEGDDDALLCITDQRNCCTPAQIGMDVVYGNWFFPNGTRVPSDTAVNGTQWDFYRTRGASVVRLNRRRGGEDGIYRCEIPDTLNNTQTIYTGVYTASTGELLLTN